MSVSWSRSIHFESQPGDAFTLLLLFSLFFPWSFFAKYGIVSWNRLPPLHTPYCAQSSSHLIWHKVIHTVVTEMLKDLCCTEVKPSRIFGLQLEINANHLLQISQQYAGNGQTAGREIFISAHSDIYVLLTLIRICINIYLRIMVKRKQH
jgi:hypothetical protein